MKTIHLIAAARPNFMKVAPLYHALRGQDWCDVKLVHTGQHYDPNMSDVFFADLGLPRPDFHLGIGSGTHAEQTGSVMIAYEKICLETPPAAIVVVGDVNSTLACALVGAKLCIPVAHLEAGLRSRDRRMPEEINRLATDAVSDLLLTPSPDADDNLRAEGHAADHVVRVGNIMMDSYELQRPRIEAARSRDQFGLPAQGYGVVTLHRPSNVDDQAALAHLVGLLVAASQRLPLVFAVHPRTRQRLTDFGLLGQLEGASGIYLVEPMGYIPFMSLISDARLIITDSGGVQEESTYLGIPCLTLRENTERPITVSEGSNRLTKPENLLAYVDEALTGQWRTGRKPDRWDGRAAGRTVDALRQLLKV